MQCIKRVKSPIDNHGSCNSGGDKIFIACVVEYKGKGNINTKYSNEFCNVSIFLKFCLSFFLVSGDHKKGFERNKFKKFSKLLHYFSSYHTVSGRFQYMDVSYAFNKVSFSLHFYCFPSCGEKLLA